MPGAPFSISQDGALWLVEQIRAGDAHSEFAGLVPAIGYVLNSSLGDGRGDILECVPYPHYLLGWHDPAEAGDGDGVWLQLFDRRFYVHNATLENLRGKHLVLQRV